MKRHKDGRFAIKPQTSGLKLMFVMTALSATINYLYTPPEPRFEPFNPFISHRVVYAQEPVAQPIVEPFKHTKRTLGCMQNRPDVTKRIKAKLNNDYALDLICRESSFNPQAINPTSGACGLAQALPCSKMKCELGDVDCQLDWISDYVIKRYGSFEKAISFHDRMNWY